MSTDERIVGICAECDAAKAARNWKEAAELTHCGRPMVLYHALHPSYGRLEAREQEPREPVAEMLMDAIEERHRVEDWRNPEKGITRVEACLAALATLRYQREEPCRHRTYTMIAGPGGTFKQCSECGTILSDRRTHQRRIPGERRKRTRRTDKDRRSTIKLEPDHE